MIRDKKKMRLGQIAHPGKVEGILSIQAEKGWFLYEIKGEKYLFQKAQPAQMEYRLLYRKDGEFGEDMIRYKELGWEMAARDEHYLVLEQRVSYGPSERYFTEREEMEWRNRAKRDLVGSILLLILCLIYFIWSGLYVQNGIHIKWYSLFNGGGLKITLLISLIVSVVGIVYAVQIRSYCRGIKERRNEIHHLTPKFGYGILLHRNMIGVLVTVCGIVLSINGMERGSVDGNTIGMLSKSEVFGVGNDEEDNLVYEEEKWSITKCYQSTHWILSDERNVTYTEHGMEERTAIKKRSIQHVYVRKMDWNAEGFFNSMLYKAITEELLNSHDLLEEKVHFSYEDAIKVETDGVNIAVMIPEKEGKGYLLAVQKGRIYTWIMVQGEQSQERVLELLKKKIGDD